MSEHVLSIALDISVQSDAHVFNARKIFHLALRLASLFEKCSMLRLNLLLPGA